MQQRLMADISDSAHEPLFSKLASLACGTDAPPNGGVKELFFAPFLRAFAHTLEMKLAFPQHAAIFSSNQINLKYLLFCSVIGWFIIAEMRSFCFFFVFFLARALQKSGI